MSAPARVGSSRPSAVCPDCHHRIDDSTSTLGELSPGRYDDDENSGVVRCYCACHSAEGGNVSSEGDDHADD